MLPMKNKLHTRSFKQKGNARYGSKRYANPFFQNKRRKTIQLDPSVSWKIKVISIAIFIIIIALIWLFLYSPYFTIRNINATGEGNFVGADKVKTETQTQIDNNMFVLWPQKNIFLFDEDLLYKNLEEKYSFDKLEIKKKLPNTLNISYIEKKYSIIWQEGEKYYYTDKAGIVVAEANPAEIAEKEYPLIVNYSGLNIENNFVKVDAKYLEYASNLYEEFKKYSGEFKIKNFLIDTEINTVKVVLQNGPQVYFNTDEMIDKQLNKLIIIKKEKINDSFANKLYIDVRIGDSVYYR